MHTGLMGCGLRVQPSHDVINIPVCIVPYCLYGGLMSRSGNLASETINTTHTGGYCQKCHVGETQLLTSIVAHNFANRFITT